MSESPPDSSLVVNHLTRMREAFVCVAGFDNGHRHVRPQRRYGRWDRSHVAPRGPFCIGCAVDLGPTRVAGQPPEVEDHIVLDESRLMGLGRLQDHAFWELLGSVAVASLVDVFGDALHRRDSGAAAVPMGRGIASLGCYRPSGDVELVIEGRRVRLLFQDEELGRMQLPVTDLRLFPADDPVVPLLAVVGRRLAAGEEAVLSVGLSRPFEVQGVQSHWLQVNNINFRDYFDDHPVFRRFRAS